MFVNCLKLLYDDPSDAASTSSPLWTRKIYQSIKHDVASDVALEDTLLPVATQYMHILVDSVRQQEDPYYVFTWHVTNTLHRLMTNIILYYGVFLVKPAMSVDDMAKLMCAASTNKIVSFFINTRQVYIIPPIIRSTKIRVCATVFKYLINDIRYHNTYSKFDKDACLFAYDMLMLWHHMPDQFCHMMLGFVTACDSAVAVMEEAQQNA